MKIRFIIWWERESGGEKPNAQLINRIGIGRNTDQGEINNIAPSVKHCTVLRSSGRYTTELQPINRTDFRLITDSQHGS